MNEEQNTPGNTETSSSSSDANESNKGGDNYYAVDDPKRDFNSTIGDGEMHNEGLVGDGTDSEDSTFSEGTTSEQDEAENHDSEG